MSLLKHWLRGDGSRPLKRSSGCPSSREVLLRVSYDDISVGSLMGPLGVICLSIYSVSGGVTAVYLALQYLALFNFIIYLVLFSCI